MTDKSATGRGQGQPGTRRNIVNRLADGQGTTFGDGRCQTLMLQCSRIVMEPMMELRKCRDEAQGEPQQHHQGSAGSPAASPASRIRRFSHGLCTGADASRKRKRARRRCGSSAWAPLAFGSVGRVVLARRLGLVPSHCSCRSTSSRLSIQDSHPIRAENTEFCTVHSTFKGSVVKKSDSAFSP